MQCPYCMSEISNQAITCPHCARDIYLIKILQEKIEELEAQLQNAQQFNAIAQQTREKPDSVVEETSDASLFSTSLMTWGILWLLPLVLLLTAHYLITVFFDINLIYLRAVSLLIPLPFAFTLMLQKRGFVPWILSAFAMAGLAVLGMSYTINLVDGDPVLPQNAREVREFIEYAASIGLSYVTGMILGNMLRQHRTMDMNGFIHRMVAITSSSIDNIEKIQIKVQKFQKISGFLTAASTTAASIYNGFKIF